MMYCKRLGWSLVTALLCSPLAMANINTGNMPDLGYPEPNWYPIRQGSPTDPAVTFNETTSFWGDIEPYSTRNASLCKWFNTADNGGRGICQTDISWIHAAVGLAKSVFSDPVVNYILRFHLEGACYRSTQYSDNDAAQYCAPWWWDAATNTKILVNQTCYEITQEVIDQFTGLPVLRKWGCAHKAPFGGPVDTNATTTAPPATTETNFTTAGATAAAPGAVVPIVGAAPVAPVAAPVAPVVAPVAPVAAAPVVAPVAPVAAAPVAAPVAPVAAAPVAVAAETNATTPVAPAGNETASAPENTTTTTDTTAAAANETAPPPSDLEPGNTTTATNATSEPAAPTNATSEPAATTTAPATTPAEGPSAPAAGRRLQQALGGPSLADPDANGTSTGTTTLTANGTTGGTNVGSSNVTEAPATVPASAPAAPAPAGTNATEVTPANATDSMPANASATVPSAGAATPATDTAAASPLGFPTAAEDPNVETTTAVSQGRVIATAADFVQLAQVYDQDGLEGWPNRQQWYTCQDFTEPFSTGRETCYREAFGKNFGLNAVTLRSMLQVMRFDIANCYGNFATNGAQQGAVPNQQWCEVDTANWIIANALPQNNITGTPQTPQSLDPTLTAPPPPPPPPPPFPPPPLTQPIQQIAVADPFAPANPSGGINAPPGRVQSSPSEESAGEEENAAPRAAIATASATALIAAMAAVALLG